MRGWGVLSGISIPNTSSRSDSLGRAPAGKGFTPVTKLPRDHEHPLWFSGPQSTAESGEQRAARRRARVSGSGGL